MDDFEAAIEPEKFQKYRKLLTKYFMNKLPKFIFESKVQALLGEYCEQHNFLMEALQADYITYSNYYTNIKEKIANNVQLTPLQIQMVQNNNNKVGGAQPPTMMYGPGSVPNRAAPNLKREEEEKADNPTNE
jgi:hypothetical protein